MTLAMEDIYPPPEVITAYKKLSITKRLKGSFISTETVDKAYWLGGPESVKKAMERLLAIDEIRTTSLVPIAGY